MGSWIRIIGRAKGKVDVSFSGWARGITIIIREVQRPWWELALLRLTMNFTTLDSRTLEFINSGFSNLGFNNPRIWLDNG